MFFGVKCISLKMLRVLPTIWISFVNGKTFCWIPRNGYGHKIKNKAQPPNETDLEGRKGWHYSDCEILFNKKVFLRLNDGELALSKLNYDPVWYYNMTTESGPRPVPVEHAVNQLEHVVLTLPPALLLQSQPFPLPEPSPSQLNDVLLSYNSALTFNVERTEDVFMTDHGLTESLQSPVGQHSVEISATENEPEDVLLPNNSALAVVFVEPAINQLEHVVSTLPPALLLQSQSFPLPGPSPSQPNNVLLSTNNSESLPSPAGQHSVEISATENEPEDVLLPNNSALAVVFVEPAINQLEHVVSTLPPALLLQSQSFPLPGPSPSQPNNVLLSTNNSESLPSPAGQHPVDLQSESFPSPSSSQLDDVLLSSNSAPMFIVERTVECATEKQLPFVMSGHSSSEPNNFPSIASHYDRERYNENKRICEQHGFKAPVHYREFEKLEWNYVRTFNVNYLQAGQRFTTLGELSLIPRKYNVPFCRPGPVRQEKKYHWYLVDSIVQQVHVKTIHYPYFVVRWVGYEDVYNTLEPLHNVQGTAVYKLFPSPDLFTACRLNGCILRRSERQALQKKTIPIHMMVIEPSTYERAMNKLTAELRVEEEADRYSPDIGFYSYQSVTNALLAQHRFLIDKFGLLIKELQSPLFFDTHYIGPIFGNLGQDARFKNLVKVGKMMVVSEPRPLRDYISRGISGNSKMFENSNRFVSFFVQRKFDITEKHDKNNLNFHMCVFTVRAYGRKRDAIYYDPSPKYFGHQLPPVLNNLIEPVLESFTHKFGDGSEKDDCTFQCMQYIIAMATGEVQFLPDLSDPCRKIDKHMAERASKKMKFEN